MEVHLIQNYFWKISALNCIQFFGYVTITFRMGSLSWTTGIMFSFTMWYVPKLHLQVFEGEAVLESCKIIIHIHFGLKLIKIFFMAYDLSHLLYVYSCMYREIIWGAIDC